ncbi:MAG: hypothetical protein QM758_02615 [Armatimonas sp.]
MDEKDLAEARARVKESQEELEKARARVEESQKELAEARARARASVEEMAIFIIIAKALNKAGVDPTKDPVKSSMEGAATEIAKLTCERSCEIVHEGNANDIAACKARCDD